MANFETVIPWLLFQEDDRREPGKIVDLHDGAGFTRLGITSKNFSTVMDPTFWTTMPFQTAVQHAKWLYQEEYWHHINGDKITDDQTAAMILSWSINRSIPTAVRALQRVLGLPQDGVLGAATLQELNSKDVVAPYRAEWISFYHKLVDSNPNDQRFLDGWIARANFPYPSPLVGNLYQ